MDMDRFHSKAVTRAPAVKICQAGLTVLNQTWHFSPGPRRIFRLMRTILTCAALVVLSVHQGHCQDPAPAFEVASVTPCKPGTPEPPGEHMGMVQFTYPGGRFVAKATSVKFLFEWAYGLLPAQHSGGPSWIDNERYDIVAKAPGNANDHTMKLMAQALLKERFHLEFHRETRDVPVILISVGKNPPKLSAPKDDEKHSLHVAPQMGADQKITSYHVVATRFSIEQLNETFSRQLGRVIVNETGLDGDFDFSLDLTPDETRPNPLDASLIISAMHDQLGFVVKSQKAPIEFLVIDSIEKVAAGNQ
jgi:uncharacterized protein (TIGR03435 family)